LRPSNPTTGFAALAVAHSVNQAVVSGLRSV
jgi:hypothetical protein